MTARERVTTYVDGGLHIEFLDKSVIKLGSGASVVLDEYVYDGQPGSGRMVATVGRGVARFVSGNMNQQAVSVRTPMATMGIRGTDFSVWVEESGRTTIWVNQGSIHVTPTDGAIAAEVVEGETVLAAGAGAGVERDARRPPPDPGIDTTFRFRPKL